MARTIQITIQLPQPSLIERIARRLGTTTTRCPYCDQWDARPASHLARKHDS